MGEDSAVCCGREQKSTADPVACPNLLVPESALVELAGVESDNDSSTTVSASSEASLEERQCRWDAVKAKYRQAKYLAAKQRAKESRPSDIVTVQTRTAV